MSRRHGMPRERSRAVLIAVGLLGGFALLGPLSAEAGEFRLALGFLAGSTRPDPDLSRYNWDVGGHATWGLRALAGKGRLGAGLRLVRWQTVQGTGIPGSGDGPTVRLTDVQLRLRARTLSVGALDLLGMAGAGRYHMGYSPDRMTVDSGGGQEPVEVAFDSVDDWSFALGVGVERPVVPGLVVGAEIERSLFFLDTAHRSGSEIVASRDSFSNWNLRLSLSWMLRKP